MLLSFYQSTIGKKIIVALTGVILFGFVVGHLLGNLQIFAGPDKINQYAQFLHNNPPLLWGTRVVLLLAVFFHVVNTVQLTRRNRQSRPIDYREKKTVQATLASRIMIWSGVFLGFYIVFHLLHLTVGTLHPNFEPLNIYSNVVSGLSVGWVSVFYMLGLAALGYHLYHGVWSVFQTLGLNHPKYNHLRRAFAIAAAVFLALGYIAIPVAVLTKCLQ